MNENDWRQALSDLKKDLAAVEARAAAVSTQMPGICRPLESLKLDILEWKLERKRRQAARVRGFTAIGKDRKKLGISLAAAVVGMTLAPRNYGSEAPNEDRQGMSDRNNLAAWDGGMRGFDGCLQAFGSSEWAVSMDRNMLVASADQTIPGRHWISWQELIAAIGHLRAKAVAGVRLGGMDAIISELKKGCEAPTDHIRVQRVRLIRGGNC